MTKELGETTMQIGIDSFAAAYDDASLAVSASDRLRNLVEQIESADQVGLDVFGIGEHHRPGVPRFRSCGHSRSGRRHERTAYVSPVCYGPELSRPGTGVSELRYPRSSFARPGGDGRRPRFLHRVFSVVRLEAGGLRLTFCREARPAFEDPRERARPLVRQTSRCPDRPGRLPETGAESFTDMAGRWRDPTIVRSCWRAWSPLMVAIIGGQPSRFRPLIDLYRETGKRSDTRPID